MRTTLIALVVATGLAVPTLAITTAQAAPTNRPGGEITTPEAPTPGNGGDQGWGNCGHNSSKGNPHTGDNGNGGGNGGDAKDDCVTVPTDTDTDGGGLPT